MGTRRRNLLGVRKRLELWHKNSPGGCHEHTLGSIPWAQSCVCCSSASTKHGSRHLLIADPIGTQRQ